MVFTECEFDGGFNAQPGMRFETCLFEIKEGDPLPSPWQCMNCIVVCGGEIELYGFSSN